MARAATPAGPKTSAAAKRKRPRASTAATFAADSAQQQQQAGGKQQQRRHPTADAEEEQVEDDDDDNNDEQEEAKEQQEEDDDGGDEEKEAEGEEKPKPRRGRRRLLHDEEQRKQRRKNQCKLNQRRYRARQRGMISTLSLETDSLGDFIHELEAYQQFLRQYTQCEEALAAAGNSSSPAVDARPLLVVDQFLQFFQHGFALHSVEISDIQERFVRFISAPDLISQGATRGGVDALLLQLKRYTSYHTLFQLRVDARRVVHSPEQQQQEEEESRRSRPGADAEGAPAPSAWVVQASGRMHLRLSRDTVMLVYPHIVKDEALSYRVVGHEIDPPFSFVFQFNEAGKVCKLEVMVDFAGAFMALLHSAALVSELLGRALISPQCELGIDPHEESAVGGAAGDNKQLSLKFILL